MGKSVSSNQSGGYFMVFKSIKWKNSLWKRIENQQFPSAIWKLRYFLEVGGVRWVLQSFSNHAYLFLHLLSSILASTHRHIPNPPPKTIKHCSQKWKRKTWCCFHSWSLSLSFSSSLFSCSIMPFLSPVLVLATSSWWQFLWSMKWISKGGLFLWRPIRQRQISEWHWALRPSMGTTHAHWKFSLGMWKFGILAITPGFTSLRNAC